MTTDPIEITVPLSQCHTLRNFTYADFVVYLCDKPANPTVTILDPAIGLPDKFTFDEQIVNPSGTSEDVVGSMIISGLSEGDIISVTRDGVSLPFSNAKAGGVEILYGGVGTDFEEGTSNTGAWVIQYAPTAPAGTYSTTIEFTDGSGRRIAKTKFDVLVPSTTDPFVVSITPAFGDPGGGTSVTIRCYNLDLVPSLATDTPVVLVGGSPLFGVSVDVAAGLITGETEALTTGNDNNSRVEIQPTAEPSFGTDNLWDWVIDQWFETQPLNRWADVDPTDTWLVGV
jgi:hypothetical protein